MTVRIKPNRMPKSGLVKNARNASKALEPINGFTPSVIKFRPMKSTPKPMQISPIGFADLRLINISRIIPMTSATGARVSVSNSQRNQFVPASMSDRRIICAVTVVPILAPITMDTACLRFRTPAPISATVRTMVAVEL